MAADVTWYTTGEVAQLLGVSDRTVVNWARAGRIAHFTTPGGHRRYRVEDVQAFLAQRSTSAH
jgi:excisionase family DNA binding protein